MTSSSHVLAFTDTIVKMKQLDPNLSHNTGLGFLGFEPGHFFVSFKEKDRRQHFEHMEDGRAL